MIVVNNLVEEPLRKDRLDLMAESIAAAMAGEIHSLVPARCPRCDGLGWIRLTGAPFSFDVPGAPVPPGANLVGSNFYREAYECGGCHLLTIEDYRILDETYTAGTLSLMDPEED